MMSDNIEFTISSFGVYVRSKWIAECRWDITKLHEIKVIDSKFNDVIDVITNKVTSWNGSEVIDYKGFADDESNYYIYNYDFFIELVKNNNLTKINIYYKHESHRDMLDNFIRDKFMIAEGYVKWIYNNYMEEISIPLDKNVYPYTEMYPFLNGESVDEYYERFLSSPQAILVLIGEPGTGKSSFINGLIQYSKKVARVCYDTRLMESDSIFADFISSDDTFFVIEDADTLMIKREKDNPTMHKFLNVGEGLAKVKNKKIIFSTNLPTTKDIDTALIRPGRCFDILEFKPLTTEQAKPLIDKLGLTFTLDSGKMYTVAEIFNNKENETKTTRTIGFI